MRPGLLPGMHACVQAPYQQGPIILTCLSCLSLGVMGVLLLPGVMQPCGLLVALCLNFSCAEFTRQGAQSVSGGAPASGGALARRSAHCMGFWLFT